MQAEIGTGLGGDFSYNSFLADIRSYLILTRDSGFDFRLRGGYSQGEVPEQKKFTLGGVGSVRAYPQNVFVGTRMLLANAEYTLYKQGLMDGVFDQLSIFGLFDAGWTNKLEVNKFEWNDVYSAAGFGVALDDRFIRLELAWPLRDVGTGTDPTLWLRLNPTF